MAKVTKTYTRTRERISDFIKESPWSTVREISEGTGLAPSTVRTHIKDMEAGGYLVESERQLSPKRSVAVWADNEFVAKMAPRPVEFDAPAEAKIKEPELHRITLGLFPYDVAAVQVRMEIEAGDGEEPGPVADLADIRGREALPDTWSMVIVGGALTPLGGGTPVYISYFDQDFGAQVTGHIKQVSVKHRRNKPQTESYLYECQGVGELGLEWPADA